MFFFAGVHKCSRKVFAKKSITLIVKVPVIFENENFDACSRQNLTIFGIEFIKIYLMCPFSKIENK